MEPRMVGEGREEQHETWKVLLDEIFQDKV